MPPYSPRLNRLRTAVVKYPIIPVLIVATIFFLALHSDSPPNLIETSRTKRDRLDAEQQQHVIDLDVRPLQQPVAPVFKPSRVKEQVVGQPTSTPLLLKRFDNFLGGDRGYEDVEMMDGVRDMMKHAWKGYLTYANNTDELRPISRRGHNWYNDQSLLATPVDSLDTFWLMGLHDEYTTAKAMVLDMSFDKPITINLFETIIRQVGGLLSAYDLDGDVAYIKKCVELVDRVMPAFNGTLGIPGNQVQLQNAVPQDGRGGVIAEIGTLQLEFQYLSDVTGDDKYAKAGLKIYETMHAAITAGKGLYATQFGILGGGFAFAGDKYGLGAGADSHYEYLLKLWISTGEEKYRAWYDESAETFSSMFVKEANGHTWIPNTYYTSSATVPEPTMEHLACFSGGMFSLGALTSRRGNWTRELYIGEQVTKTCYGSYNTSKTGLGPERFTGDNLQAETAYYILRPEVIESIFYMWRFTHDPIYREYGRNIVQALITHCKNEAGFSGLTNVNNPSSQDDLQQSFFLAETLKYLYLLFTSDDTLPLEDYVLNTEAHPISIRGRGRRANPKTWSPIPFKTKEYGGLEPRDSGADVVVKTNVGVPENEAVETKIVEMSENKEKVGVPDKRKKKKKKKVGLSQKQKSAIVEDDIRNMMKQGHGDRKSSLKEPVE
ncbi:hypothetical protein SmJEL517_g02598 [Synchytrium microbalum]|uniref:alpha-1,2-Mannosidase n=1 Tax=Synchytrium microbalum TaxID=1806994 RepID=A0A507C6E3_9FUNG|nr:uncharacterized protein SmJEL517_g02598 [Synchytrium microbalum]TPX34918.1 hypothetical protein SmJEL517_g02598 [Synchytrium microbalum]